MKWSLLAIGALALAGCNSSGGGEGEKTAVKDNGGIKTFTIGMSQCYKAEPYRGQMDRDIADAAKSYPELKVVFKDAGNDTVTQQSQVREFIQDKVDLIIISPKEAQPLTAPVGEAIDAGIPVIVLDRKIVGDKYTCFIGADNKKIGLAAGKWLNERLHGKGDIVELKGLMTSTPAQDRHEGFMKGIQGSQIKIVKDPEMKWQEGEARSEMESVLATVPHIDAVYSHNDPGAHGAYLAAKAAGREKEMLFMGIDALPQEGQVYVKQGILAVSFQYPTGGKEAVETALKILHKEKFDKDITLASKFFTPENIDKGGELIKE